MNARTRETQRGYSLVEVLLAMALLGAVLMSIMALFVFGRKNVYSGKQMTQAVTLANQVMETMSGMDKTGIVAAFGLPSTVGSAQTVAGVSYANSFLRTTSDITTTTDPSGYLQIWKDDIVNNNRFSNGVVSVVVTPLFDSDSTHTTPQMGTATMIRVRAIVTWTEGRRSRQVSLDSVKVYR